MFEKFGIILNFPLLLYVNHTQNAKVTSPEVSHQVPPVHTSRELFCILGLASGVSPTNPKGAELPKSKRTQDVLVSAPWHATGKSHGVSPPTPKALSNIVALLQEEINEFSSQIDHKI